MILGATKTAQLADTLGSLDFTIPAELRKRLDEVGKPESIHPYNFYTPAIQHRISGGTTVNGWRRDASLWLHPNEGIILASAAGAVGLQLGGAAAPGITPDRSKTFDAIIADTCGNNDCDGCCRENSRGGFLVDMEFWTATRRIGGPDNADGTIKFVIKN